MSFIQLPLAEPELGSVDGAGVELQPEHRVSVGALGSPVVAFHLKRAAESEVGWAARHLTDDSDKLPVLVNKIRVFILGMKFISL